MKTLILVFTLFGLIIHVNPSNNCENDFCNITASSIYTPNCFCSHCEQYNDCCEDMVSAGLSRLNKFVMSECNIKLNQSFHTYSITKCDESIAKELNRKQVAQCEDSNNTDAFNRVPVYSVQTSLTYRNIHCAQCNIKNIKLSDLRFFSMKALYHNMDTNDDEKELTKNVLEEYFNNTNIIKSDFEIEFENPIENANIRYCVRSIDSCPNNSSDFDKEQCAKYPTAYRYLGI